MRRLLGKGRCVRRLLLLLRMWRMRWKWLGLSSRRLIRWWLLIRHHRGRRMGLTHLKLLLGIRRLLLLLLTRLTITLPQLMR